RDLGIGPVKRHQATRQPVIRDRLARLHGERAALEAAELGESKLGGRCAVEHASRLLEKQPAGFGQLDAAADAVQQRGPIGILERDARGAARLLRQVQGLRRTSHVLAFGDSDEDAQLLEGHAGFIAASVEACPRACAARVVRRRAASTILLASYCTIQPRFWKMAAPAGDTRNLTKSLAVALPCPRRVSAMPASR